MSEKPESNRKRRRKRNMATVRNSYTSPKQIEMQAKRAEALDYRIQSYSYPQIAEAMGCSISSAFEYVDEAIKQITREKAMDVRELELARISGLMTTFYPAAMGGDATAANMVLRLMERQAKLEGYDLPDRVEVSGPNGGAIVNAIEVSFVVPRAKLNGGNGHVIEHED